MVATVAMLAIASAAGAALKLTPRITFSNNVNGSHEMVLADLNGDGAPDAATVSNVGTVNLKRSTTAAGDQTPTFSATNTTIAVGTSPDQIAAGDVNGDGTLDVIVPNDDDHVIVIPMNPSASAISPGSAVTLSEGADTNPDDVAVGDIDADGRPDIVTTSVAADAIRVYRNTTTIGNFAPTFAAPVALGTPTADPGAVTIADVNRDGKPDVVAAAQNQAVVFLSTSSPGTISFAPANSVPTGGNTGGTTDSIAAGDINGDGNTDFAITDGTFLTRVLINTTPSGGAVPTGTAANITDPGQNAAEVSLADFTGDGRPDLVEKFNSDLRLRIATGVPLFTAITPDPDTEFSPQAVAVADLNRDGVPDVAAPNGGSNGSFSFFDVFMNVADIHVAGSVPSTIDFGTVPQGTFGSPQLVGVSNAGAAPLPGPSTVTGAASGDWLLSSNSCGDAIEPGESCQVGLRFGPTTTGARSGALNFGLAPNALTPTVGLTGTGGPLPQGPAGASGADGAAGTPGTAGAKGDTGPQGPQGAKGRDAVVKCRVKKLAPRRGKQRFAVRCTVTHTPATRTTLRLLRNGRVYASGNGTTLRTHARLPAGRYTLKVITRDRLGRVLSVVRRRVRIG